jgi:hypothetical protein
MNMIGIAITKEFSQVAATPIEEEALLILVVSADHVRDLH